jgi:predicted nucleic acid-binding protein
LLNDDEGADDCEKILDEAKEEKTIIVVSPLVQVEVVRPRSSPRPIPKEDAEKVRAFLRMTISGGELLIEKSQI